MDATLALLLLGLAAVAALTLLVLLVVVLVRGVTGSRRVREANVPADLAGLRREVAELKTQMRTTTRHLGVVRYDAFGDMGGRLSWSVALADDRGDGVVLTSIHGRSEARSYAKDVRGWSSDQPLSPEEEEAIKVARES